MGDFSHLNEAGEAAMVDVSEKKATERVASAVGLVKISAKCMESLTDEAYREICTTARIAAIQAAKNTYQIVPLCHQIPVSGIKVDIKLDRTASLFQIRTSAKTVAGTGVEMEALTAAQTAGLVIYDMIKAVNPEAILGPFCLEEKQGGKTGHWTRP